jgi:hypothetical protein
MTTLAYDTRTACEDDPSLFHAPDQESRTARAEREAAAKAICFACPTAVRESCLQIAMAAEHGLSAGNRNGIYGGLNEQERADLDEATDPGTYCHTCDREFKSRSARTQHVTLAHSTTGQDRIDKIRRLAGSGMSDAEIAPHVGMSPDVVGRNRRRYGIAPGVEPSWKAS